MLLNQYGIEMPSSKSRASKPFVSKIRLTQDRDTLTPYTTFDAHKTASEAIDFKLSFVSEEQLAKMGASELLETLVISDPSLSRARTDMQMYVNSGYDIEFLETSEASIAEAEAIIESALLVMRERKEPFKIKLDKLISSGFIKGAFYTEVVFGGQTDEEFIDWRIIDPFRMAYREQHDEIRGDYIEYGEEINGEFVAIDSPTVQYIPMNPTEKSPVGIPMVSSAIFPIIFLLGMYKAVRQVIESQAWPQGIITIDRDKFVAPFRGFGDDVEPDFDDVDQKIQELCKDIESKMAGASKNEVFVFSAEVAYQIVGAMGRTNLDAVQMMQQVLDRQIVRALKQFPVIFGIAEGNALSTNAEQQSEAHVVFIEWFQNQIEDLVSNIFEQILRRAGNAAKVIFSLKRQHAIVERYRAERMEIKTNSVVKWLELGIIDRQEARDLIRNPESFDKLSEILEPEVPEEVDIQPTQTESESSEEGSDQDAEE